MGAAYRAQPVERLDTTPVAADARQHNVGVAGEQRLERCDFGGDDLDRKELVAQSFGDGGSEYAP